MIVVAEPDGFPASALARLRQVGAVRLVDLKRAGLLAALGDATVLWVRLRTFIDAGVLNAAPSLRVIATPTTGLTHVDVEEVHRRGIRIVSLRGELEFLKTIRATAEFTVALMLALLRRLPHAVQHVQEGGWNRDLFKGSEIHGKTVGIVGYGRLGRIVAKYVSAFEARVIVADPQVERDANVPCLALPELLASADIVTLHVNLCAATRGLFGPAQFAAMRPGAWFVNTSRGELVCEQALLEALTSGRLAGAALDVISDEHQQDLERRPLVRYARDHGNLLITPHIGGYTGESLTKAEAFLADRLAALMQEASFPATASRSADTVAGNPEQ